MALGILLPLIALIVVAFHPASTAQVPAGRLYVAAAAGLTAVSLAITIFILYRRARRTLAGLSLHESLAATLGHAFAFEVSTARPNTIAALSSAIEARTQEAAGHNLRVSDLALSLGQEIELSPERMEVLARASLLHDIGKLGIPEAVLAKPSALNDLDWALLRTHPELGSQILAQMGDLEAERAIVAAQQERLDGSGYPHGLKGDQIPMEARILGVVTAYEALVSPRPYREPHTSAEALNILLAERGTTLDPVVVDALLRLLAGQARTTRP
jgi:HD-GYP domain-containing protein (c-di-GMP phosphodiesterase class II)